MHEGETASSALGKAVHETLELVKNPEKCCIVSFLSAFNAAYCAPGYNWIHKYSSKSNLEVHNCHESLIQVRLRFKKIHTLKSN